MKEYVLVFAVPISKNNKVLLVLKNRPAWQAGFFNLVGGKIEEKETPLEAGIRELKEESGLSIVEQNGEKQIKLIGKICGEWGTTFCTKAVVGFEDIKPREKETEKVMWVETDKILNSTQLLPNLRVIIPFMLCGVENWKIIDSGPTWETEKHIFSVEVESYKK
jgi:8-oxo-dGTP pyrophosphatase MutT (NUDIX family)